MVEHLFPLTLNCTGSVTCFRRPIERQRHTQREREKKREKKRDKEREKEGERELESYTL